MFGLVPFPKNNLLFFVTRCSIDIYSKVFFVSAHSLADSGMLDKLLLIPNVIFPPLSVWIEC